MRSVAVTKACNRTFKGIKDERELWPSLVDVFSKLPQFHTSDPTLAASNGKDPLTLFVPGQRSLMSQMTNGEILQTLDPVIVMQG